MAAYALDFISPGHLPRVDCVLQTWLCLPRHMHEERFQLPSPFQDKKCKIEIYLMLLQITSACKRLVRLWSGYYRAAAIHAMLAWNDYVFVQYKYSTLLSPSALSAGRVLPFYDMVRNKHPIFGNVLLYLSKMGMCCHVDIIKSRFVLVKIALNPLIR